MRITRDTLLKIARTAAADRSAADHTMICIYLTGSLCEPEPLLGGSTDIDLVCVHTDKPKLSREIVRITDEVTLDIYHHSQEAFQPARKLRSDPWLGGYLAAGPLMLFDLRHWFEFTQASAAAQFFRPDNILSRVRPLSDTARQSWLSLEAGEGTTHILRLKTYLQILEQAGNAVNCLVSTPLPDRRFWLLFSQRTNYLGRPGLETGLSDLFLPSSIDEESWQAWMIAWENAYTTVGEQSNCPVHLLPPRRDYYKNAILAAQTDAPAAAFWLMLRTWTDAVSCLRSNSTVIHGWNQMTKTVNLDEASMKDRLNALDIYLDGVEETIDTYARKNGI